MFRMHDRSEFPNRRHSRQAGLTLLELIITCAILLVLATAAMPVARFTVKRQKEAELRRDLREMRDAIDRYKDAADRNLIRVEAGTEGYPPDLQTLVKGVDLTSQPGAGANLGGIGGIGGVVSGQSGSATTPFGSSSNFGSSFGSPGGSQGGSSFGSSGFGSSGSGFGSTGSTGAAGSGAGAPLIQHVRFLRRIPVDPMTGRAEWGMRSVSDDPSSTSWGGKDVFDIFSQSTDTGLDGTRYQDW